MSKYTGKKDYDKQREFANLVKSVYESSTRSDDRTVSELVEEIKAELIKIIK